MNHVKRPWYRLYSSTISETLSGEQKSMMDIFEETASRNPHAPAIHYYESTTSFSELDGYSNRLAALLYDWGIQAGDRVGIYLQNDPQFLVAQYAAWKRNAIVVPLNPMLKQDELEFHIQDAGIRILVCLESLYHKFEDFFAGNPVIEHILLVPDKEKLVLSQMQTTERHFSDDHVVHLTNAIASMHPHPLARAKVGPEDTAYLVYTSGTTGRPKGAMNLHRNVSFNARVYEQWMDIQPSDIILGMAPLFHVTGIVGHSALSAMAGIPLVLSHRFDAEVVLDMITKWRPSMTVAAITAYIALLNHSKSSQTDFSSLTKCYSGGAAIPASVVERFEQKCGIYIHNIYGLTETNSPTHAVPLNSQAPVDAESGALSIGIPVPNCDAKIVDLKDTTKEVSAGDAGELAVTGPMVFGGYWNRQEASAAAFSKGYFLTGDIARMDTEGWFYIVDRKKDMINASGYKVWPREVEDVIYQIPEVKEVAVVGVPDEYRGEDVKAYVSLYDDYVGKVTAEQITNFCKARLAAYKYPRHLEFVDDIPKTATGKILRRKLRDKET